MLKLALKKKKKQALDFAPGRSLLHSDRVHSALLRTDPISPSSPTDGRSSSGVSHNRRTSPTLAPRDELCPPQARTVLPRIYRLYPSSRLRRYPALSVCERSGYMPLFSIYISRSVWGLPVEDLLTLTALPSPTSIPVSRVRLGSIFRLNLVDAKRRETL